MEPESCIMRIVFMQADFVHKVEPSALEARPS